MPRQPDLAISPEEPWDAAGYALKVHICAAPQPPQTEREEPAHPREPERPPWAVALVEEPALEGGALRWKRVLVTVSLILLIGSTVLAALGDHRGPGRSQSPVIAPSSREQLPSLPAGDYGTAAGAVPPANR